MIHLSTIIKTEPEKTRMDEIIDIPIIDLLVFHLILVIPVLLSFYYRLSLIRNILIAFSRMSIQLFLLGLYLQYLFDINSFWLNLGWLFIMVLTTNYHILSSSGFQNILSIHFLQFLWGVSWALLFSILPLFFVVLKADFIFDVRYFIPLSGMVLGNALRGNIIALERFLSDVNNQRSRIELDLCDGATYKEATNSLLKDALRGSLAPILSTFSTMGIISIPGMMTGQILAGNDPQIAVKYQIVIAIAIFFMVFTSTLFYLRIAQKK